MPNLRRSQGGRLSTYHREVQAGSSVGGGAGRVTWQRLDARRRAQQALPPTWVSEERLVGGAGELPGEEAETDGEALTSSAAHDPIQTKERQIRGRTWGDLEHREGSGELVERLVHGGAAVCAQVHHPWAGVALPIALGDCEAPQSAH
jgi:hypothetical protein